MLYCPIVLSAALQILPFVYCKTFAVSFLGFEKVEYGLMDAFVKFCLRCIIALDQKVLQQSYADILYIHGVFKEIAVFEWAIIPTALE